MILLLVFYILVIYRKRGVAFNFIFFTRKRTIFLLVKKMLKEKDKVFIAGLINWLSFM